MCSLRAAPAMRRSIRRTPNRLPFLQKDGDGADARRQDHSLSRQDRHDFRAGELAWQPAAHAPGERRAKRLSARFANVGPGLLIWPQEFGAVHIAGMAEGSEPTTVKDRTRPCFPARAVITGGMPYGNKDLHFGHVGGVFVHADAFTRFLKDRIGPGN